MGTRAKEQVTFTTSKAEKLRPPASGRRWVYDTKVGSLALCVTAAGAKSWYLYKWDSNAGKPVRYRLGSFPGVGVKAARDAAERKLGELAAGKDIVGHRRDKRNAPTLQQLFEHWIAHAKRHKKTWKDDQRQWDKYLAEHGSRKLSSITKGDVAAWHATIGEKHGPVMANRVRALLSAMFNVADDIGFSGQNPVTKVKRFKESSRERFLQDSEMVEFFTAVRKQPPTWRDFFLLALFTGARRGNVASMRWADLDLPRGCWHLPGQFAKNGLPVVVVLPPPAVTILNHRRESANGSKYVFPADSATGHVIDPRKAWEHVRKDSGLPDLRMHDLRRSLGSWQATAGVSLSIIGASLGHKDLKSTQVYSRLNVDPVRVAVEAAVGSMMGAGKLDDAKLLESEKGDADAQA